MRGDDQQWYGDPKKREPGVLYTTQPLNWPLTHAMQAERRKFIEENRDTRARLYMIEMARFILKCQEEGKRTVPPRSLPQKMGWGDLVGHLRSLGVLRKSDAPGGGWYYILTPCARDWAMYVTTQEATFLNPRWPDADPSADATPGKPYAGVGGATEAGSDDQPERRFPTLGERPSREGRTDGGDDQIFPCHRQ
jgi:hypothetical protein